MEGAGRRRRGPEASEQLGAAGDAKRVCRHLESAAAEDRPVELWGPERQSPLPGFGREAAPGNPPGKPNAMTFPSQGRRPGHPCLRCLAGESGHFNHTSN
ncbi:uncharacterized protein C10orf143 homolog [Ornithorhynchus anatinus]|uniref:uncharacterized protein C10orf143 homolog n=1 Tax=Ornithorhynchus anatinus TaxID=9258 RepID=UPI0010A8A829|nr:uncharacterized protein C10orf143 homolog [Ornithorhynchus anatinus]